MNSSSAIDDLSLNRLCLGLMFYKFQENLSMMITLLVKTQHHGLIVYEV